MADRPICPPVPAACLDLPRISLPMGLELVPPPKSPGKFESPCDCTFALMGMAAPALGGLAPLEVTVDASLAMNEILGAIPQAILSLNPVLIVEAIQEAAEKIAKLLNLAPFLALPRLICSMLDFMILTLDCLIEKLTELKTIFSGLGIKLDFAISVGNSDLVAIVDCATDDASRILDALLGAFGGLAPIIGMINMLLGMIPGVDLQLEISTPPVPDLPLDSIIEAIEGFRDGVATGREVLSVVCG